MRCTRTRNCLPLYVDGRLNDRLTTRVDEHLAGCAACRGELDDLRGSLEAVRSLPDLKAPPGFHRAIVSAVRQAVHERERGRAARTRVRVLKPALALAGLLLGIGATLLLMGRAAVVQPGDIALSAPVGTVAVAPPAPVAVAPEPVAAPVAEATEVEPAAAADSLVSEPKAPAARPQLPPQPVLVAEKPAPAEPTEAPATEDAQNAPFEAYLLGSFLASEVVRPAAVEPQMDAPELQRGLVLAAWPFQPGITAAADAAPLLADAAEHNYH